MDSDSADRDNLKNLGFNVAYIFDARYLDVDGDKKLDSLLFVNSIQEMIPESAKNEIGVIDWEGEILQDIYNRPVTDARFIAAEQEFIKAICLAKLLRPNIQWGFYAIPFSHYWVSDSIAWQQANSKLQSIIKCSDVLLPSLYDYYPDSNPQAENARYFSVNTKAFLQIAKQYGKKVYPFVWHRWHDSNAKDGLHLLSPVEFSKHLQWIFSAKNNRRKINGIIWFSADAYYKTIKPKLYQDEMKPGLSFERHYSKTIDQYAQVILHAAKLAGAKIRNENR